MNIEVVLATQIVGGKLAEMDLVEAIVTRNSVIRVVRSRKAGNIHDLVRVVQLCKSNDECQYGQYGDGDLAGAPSLHILFDGTSISLNGPCIQPSRVKICRELHLLGD